MDYTKQLILNASKKDFVSFKEYLENAMELKLEERIAEKIEHYEENLFSEKKVKEEEEEDDEKDDDVAEEEDADGDDSKDDKEDEDKGKDNKKPLFGKKDKKDK